MTPGHPPIVCFPFAGDRVGGSYVSALNLIKHLDPDRYRPLVVLHNTDGKLADLLRAEGVAFEAAPGFDLPSLHSDGRRSARIPGDIGALARAIPPTTRFLRRRGVRIVHTNDGRMHSAWALPTRLARASQVWHHRSPPDSLGIRYLAPVVAERIVSVSDFALPQTCLMRRWGSPRVIRSPFDIDAVGDLDRTASRRRLLSELSAAPDTVVVGQFGSMIERKRPLTFVRTVAAMTGKAPGRPIIGVMFGEPDADMAARINAEIARLGLGDRVHVMGFRYPGLPWIAACDVLLATAVDEPFGRTLIEAMLVGTAVVATRSGGNAEAIRDDVNGCLAPADDPSALAERTLALLLDPAKMAAMRAQARDYVLANFGLKRHAEAVMAVYDEIVDLRTRPMAATAGQHG